MPDIRTMCPDLGISQVDEISSTITPHCRSCIIIGNINDECKKNGPVLVELPDNSYIVRYKGYTAKLIDTVDKKYIELIWRCGCGVRHVAYFRVHHLKE